MPNELLKPGEISIYPEDERFSDMIPLLDKLRGVSDPGLTDSELMEVHEFLKDLSERLTVLGPYFRIARDKVEELYRQAESYRYARCHH